MNTKNYLEKKKLIFWDFDGVIKDSNNEKSLAFISTVQTSNESLKKKIAYHHFKNIGLSRFKKIPLYLKWNNQSFSKKNLNKIYDNLSKKLILNVSRSKWVKGSYNYIKQNYKKQIFVLITSTPQEEILTILKKINIYKNFSDIYGFPNKKSQIISNVIKSNKVEKSQILFIGDSKNDYLAAKKNKISFLLRKTNENIELQKKIRVRMFSHFND